MRIFLLSTCDSGHAHQHYEDLQNQLDLARHARARLFGLAGVDLCCCSPWRRCRGDSFTHVPAKPALPSGVEAHSAVAE